MKAYLFDIETGIYEGEAFEDSDMLQYDNGVTAVPPPEYGHGEVAVFDRQRHLWEVYLQVLPVSC